MFRRRIKGAAQAISSTSKFKRSLHLIRTHRKSAPNLIPDILLQIFDLLTKPSEDDILFNLEAYPSLFSCLLVNKLWCDSAVQVLYKHPWRLHRLYNFRVTELAYDRCQLCRLYLTMLDRDQRRLLLEKGIILPEPQHSPTFIYASFLKCLDYGVMLESVWTVYSQSHYTYVPSEEVKLVIRALLKLFSNHCGTLSWLRFAPMSFSFDEMYFEILEDAEFNALLRPVEQLVIEANLGGCTKLFGIFASNFRNVRKMELVDLPRARNWQGDSSPKHMTDFVTVIESQHHLESLTLKECAGYLSSILCGVYSQSHTIQHLKFVHCDFRGCEPWTAIAKCRELVSIEILDCINVTGAMVQPVIDANFAQLKRVVVWNKVDPKKACNELMSWSCLFP
ncbi:hypothetical protein G9A89_018282 [Geosiphon pyriformis]|nr:hypothetical protein G9A89_018282 [Geosiphon pyriformis]